MTPLHIRIMIHYLCHPYPYAENEPAHRFSRATTQYTQQLVRKGMLVPRTPDKEDTSEYHATEGCRMYVDALCAVPLPRRDMMWTHPMLDARPVNAGE
jgi:hypothetical protein